MRVAELYRTRFSGFTAKHFHEHLVSDYGFQWGYTWTKTFLQSKGLLEKAQRHYVRATVKVRSYQDGSHAIFHGPRCLVRYDCEGLLAA